VLFSQLKIKFQSITRKDGAWPALPRLVLNFFIVMYVRFSVSCILVVYKCVPN
jgi:hypothetical protein